MVVKCRREEAFCSLIIKSQPFSGPVTLSFSFTSVSSFGVSSPPLRLNRKASGWLESEKYSFFRLDKALVKFPSTPTPTPWRMGIYNGRGGFMCVSLGLSLPFSWHGCEENFLVLHQENLVGFLEVKVMKCEAFLNLRFAGISQPHATSHSTPRKSAEFLSSYRSMVSRKQDLGMIL